ncbi:MAG: DUF4921 family protein [Gaiellales bacterium]|nr:DUF4921 family protein [Gaiellales bacterium]
MRRDYFFDRWSLIASRRNSRGHDVAGAEASAGVTPGRWSEACDFCPGNEDRTPPSLLEFGGADPHAPAGGSSWRLRVFRNRFPILPGDADAAAAEAAAAPPLYRVRPSRGGHEVVVESARHDLTPGSFSTAEWADAFRAYRARIAALEAEPGTAWVEVFKNQGALAGASREHSHSQIVALPLVPAPMKVKCRQTAAAECGFCRVVASEMAGPRMVAVNDHFVAFCPFAPQWENEVWILALRHVARLDALGEAAGRSLARMVRDVASAVEQLTPCYNLMLFSGPPGRDFHLHLEIAPHSSGAVKAGFELATGFSVLRISPEESAARYRSLISGTGPN